VPAAAPSAPVAPPSVLRGKSIEEIVSKWDKELQSNVQEFTRLAGEVAAWDKVLIENGNYISQLYNQVLAAESSQQVIEQTLTSVEAQQQELAAALDSYEKQATDLLDTSAGLRTLDTGPADAERDRNFTLAADLSTHLDDLTKSLGQMIETVNGLALSSGAEASDKDDPLTQIAEVLNEHLASLNWIDGAVGEVESKLKHVAPRLSGLSNSNSSSRRTYRA